MQTWQGQHDGDENDADSGRLGFLLGREEWWTVQETKTGSKNVRIWSELLVVMHHRNYVNSSMFEQDSWCSRGSGNIEFSDKKQ